MTTTGEREPVSRRNFLKAAGATGGVTLAAACAPAASPSASPGGPGGTASDREWNDLIAAAKQEGKLHIRTATGQGYRKAAELFEKAFPGITVEAEGASSSVSIPKITSEREAGIYNWDVAQTAISSFLRVFKPVGIVDPLLPVVMRPDVLDDKVWRDGFHAGFMDNDKRYAYVMTEEFLTHLWINTDQVKEGEIKSVKDLLDPKWRGRIMFSDVRIGTMVTLMYAVRTNLGDDVVKQLLIDQKPVYSRDGRAITEAMVRGQYAIASGVAPSTLREFTDQGLGKNVKRLDVPEARFRNSTSGGLFLFNRAPHPNAAKLFINWILSKEGAEGWCATMEWNSRRLDVAPFEPEMLPKPGATYVPTEGEDLEAPQEATRIFMENLLK